MTNVSIAGGAGNTTITAGDYMVSAAGVNNSIALGDGAYTVTLKSVSGHNGANRASITLGGAGINEIQNLVILGAVKKSGLYRRR